MNATTCGPIPMHCRKCGNTFFPSHQSENECVVCILSPAIIKARGEGFGEIDPAGKSAHEPGAKLDAGKNRLGLVLGGFAIALQEVGKVGTYGADKYTDNGWQSVPGGLDRYTDAMYRHLLAEAAGERCDPETGLPHAAHAAWNALARLHFLLEESE